MNSTSRTSHLLEDVGNVEFTAVTSWVVTSPKICGARHSLVAAVRAWAGRGLDVRQRQPAGSQLLDPRGEDGEQSAGGDLRVSHVAYRPRPGMVLPQDIPPLRRSGVPRPGCRPAKTPTDGA